MEAHLLNFTLPDNGIYAIKTLDETIGTRLDVQYYGGTGNCSDLGMRSSYNGFYAAIAGDKDSSRSLRIRDYNNTGEDVTITVIVEPVRKQTLTLNENGEITRQVPMNDYEFSGLALHRTRAEDTQSMRSIPMQRMKMRM